MSYFPEILRFGIKFIIHRISNSRKEIEIRIVSDVISQYEDSIFDLGGTAPVESIYDALQPILKSVIDSNDRDVVIPTDEGSYIPVINSNYFVDNSIVDRSDANKYQMVIKLNAPLPSSFKKLGKINILIQDSEIVKSEVIYGGKLDEGFRQFGNPLATDFKFDDVEQKIKDTNTYENRNQITSSVPERRLNAIISGSYHYKQKLVDYSNFKNFVFFSSAEKRLENFKSKLEKIETHISDISHSLTATSQDLSTYNAPATEIRNQNFESINDIINTFTDYEKYLYFDNQTTSTGSAPGLGYQYTDSSSSLSLSKNVTQEFNKEGFDVVYKFSGSASEQINVIENKYKLEEIPFNNSTGSFYLSFLMRASSSVSTNLKHNNTVTSSLPIYPMDALNLQNIAVPTATGSEYRRYIFKSSGSHWVPAGNKTIGLNQINYGINSSDIIIISSSYQSQPTTTKTPFGEDYISLTSYNTGSGETISGSFVPRGDLFNITIDATGDSNLNGLITDVKVTTDNPINIKPFSYHYSTDSDDFTNWYNGMLASASFYDAQNIQRLINNIPSSYSDNKENNQELITYVNTIGEFFDEYKVLIDDYYRLFNQGYSDYEQVPSKFNKLLAEHIGFRIMPIQDNNFLNMFGLNESLDNSEQYSNKVINNVLNNVSYLYKTKGTQNSVKALLNCYGLPSNVLRLKEAGSNLKKYDQSFLSNDTDISAVGIFDMTGSVSVESKPTDFKSIIINDSFDSNNFSFKWNTTSVLTQSAVEAVFKISSDTTTTQSLFASYDSTPSKKLWEVTLVPSSSNKTINKNKGKFQFKLGTGAGGHTTLLTNSLVAETDFYSVLDNSFINVAIQRSSSGQDTTAIHTYELIVGKNTSDKLTFLTSSKLIVDGDSQSTANKNWQSGSIDKFRIANSDVNGQYTGSVAEIKSWNSPLSLTSFKQHIYNKKSIVGNNITSSVNELMYHYPLSENHKSGSTDFIIKDTSTKKLGGDITLDINMFNSSSIVYDSEVIDLFNFPIYGNGGGNLQYSDNSVIVEDSQKLVGNLNPASSVLRYNSDMEEKDFIHTSDLFFTRSPQDIINDFLKDNLGNLDFNDLFADPRDDFKNSYPDLDNFNDTLNEYNISVDMTRFIEATKKIFNNSFVESVKKLIPAKAKLSVGNILKPTYTQRIKTPPLLSAPEREIVPQPSVTKRDFESPNELGAEFFTPPQKTFHGFQTSTSSLGTFEVTEHGFANKDTQNYDLSNFFFADVSKTNPQKLWQTGSDGLHFKNPAAPGLDGRFNTYHYEEDVVFVGITDPERVNLTTSSFSGIENTDYTSETTFENKRNLRTSRAVPIRKLGTTQQYYSTSSTAEPYGRLIDSDTRMPTNHIGYLQGQSYYNNRGTKFGPGTGGVGNSISPQKSLWNYGYFYSPFGVNTQQEWEDLSTSSFYRIELAPENNNTLRIVKTGMEQEGNQTN